MKRPQGYIQRRAKHIIRTLTADHKAVKCLVAFGENAMKNATEILAMVDWGTQYWKLQESFPVPPVPRWLWTLELVQTTMPLREELPLIPSGPHLEDICIRSPALWVYRECLVKRENNKLMADSREAAAKELPPERQVAVQKGRPELHPRTRM